MIRVRRRKESLRLGCAKARQIIEVLAIFFKEAAGLEMHLGRSRSGAGVTICQAVKAHRSGRKKEESWAVCYAVCDRWWSSGE